MLLQNLETSYERLYIVGNNKVVKKQKNKINTLYLR